MPENASKALSRISDFCESKGVKLLLINPPQLVEEIFDPSPFARDFTWIDGNNWHGAKTPSNYYDDHHLVGVGAQRYSEWLCHEVTQALETP